MPTDTKTSALAAAGALDGTELDMVVQGGASKQTTAGAIAALALTAATPTTQAVGDAADVGVGTKAARDDHKHGLPAFATPGSSAVGDAAAAGVATTLARADHKHGREAFATVGASAVGDATAAGTAVTLARSDHVHGREAFGAVTAQTTVGASSANGSAATVAHSDHTHGTVTNVAILGAALAPNAQTGTTYTLAAGDDTTGVTLANAAAITLTVPLNATVAFPIGCQIPIAALGAGQVTVTIAGGGTLNGTPGLKLRAQYSGGFLWKLGTDTWVLSGDLSA